MKKIFLFLTILFGSSLLSPLCVNASTQFYEDEYIPNVFVVRKKGAAHFYQQGRVFRNRTTNEIAYCLQPFALFDENALYESVDRIESLSDETIQKIKEIASFAYPLGSSSLEYYMATQIKIWQIIEPDAEFYFTDTLDGNKTTKYDRWFQVIDDNIRVYNQAPTYNNQTFTAPIKGSLSIRMGVSGTYEDILETTLPYTRKGNDIIFNQLKEGDYEVKVRRHFKTYSNQPILFYYSKTSQALMNRVGTEDKFFSFKIHVVDTSINVKKIDKDSKSSTPSGEASLKGAVFSLYNEQDEKLGTFTFDNSLEQKISVLTGNIDYLPFGKYKIKEEKAGTGYLCNTNTFEITIDESHPHIELAIENEVIKNKVELKKFFGNEQTLKAEAGVVFEIYDANDVLYNTVETNEEGLVTFILPYGTYRIHQKTTKEGYQKVEDFTVKVEKEGKEHHYVLYDDEEPKEPEEPEPHIEIEVPNTKKNASFPIVETVLGAAIILYGKKKIWV